MTLDPVAKGFLDQMAAAGGPSLTELPVADGRAIVGGLSALGGEPQAVAHVEDRTLPGPHGDIPVRVYRPEGPPRPVLVYLHGGGWVWGDLGMVDGLCRALSNAADVAVVSVAYRQPPEYPFPVPHGDCYAATRWVAEHGDEIGVDGARLGIGGDSAGANLAAGVAVRAKQEGWNGIGYQVLAHPETRYGTDTESYRRLGGGEYFIGSDTMQWSWDKYVQDASSRSDERVSPLDAKDLSGLPPTTILVSGYDPVRDDGLAYADRLKASGVQVSLRDYPDQIHAFVFMLGVMPAAKQAVEDIAQDCRKWLFT